MKSKIRLFVLSLLAFCAVALCSSCSSTQSGFFVPTFQSPPQLPQEPVGDGQKVRHDGYYFSGSEHKHVLKFYECGRVISLAGIFGLDVFESFLENPENRARGLTVWVGYYGSSADGLETAIYIPSSGFFPDLLLRTGVFNRGTFPLVEPNRIGYSLPDGEVRWYSFRPLKQPAFKPTW